MFMLGIAVGLLIAFGVTAYHEREDEEYRTYWYVKSGQWMEACLKARGEIDELRIEVAEMRGRLSELRR